METRSQETSVANDDDSRTETPGEDSDVDMDNDWEDTIGWWEERGKETRRQLSSETAVEEDNQARLLVELKTSLEEVLPGGRDDMAQCR